MNRVVTGLLATTAVLGVSSAAFAQDWLSTTGFQSNRGLYIEGTGGATWAEGLQSNTGPLAAPFAAGGHNFTTHFDAGWAAGGRVGYGWRNGFRAEGEFVYRNNDVHGTQIDPALPLSATTDAGGRVQSVALMVNGLYDVPTGTRFTPYVGGGAGALWARQDLTAPIVSGPSLLGTYEVHSEQWLPAVQAIGGVSYAINPSLSVAVDYRYIRGFGFDRADNSGNSTSDDYGNHTVFAALRYTFGAPPPPVIPAAAPAPAPQPESQVYLIFFDFDRYNLTPDGREVVNQVAQRAQQPNAGVQRIQVNGHTDRAGSPQYNQGLSQRRAESVRRALIERGVPANEIVTRAFGETQPRVPTADGVREPQNRRVEIIFS